MIVPIEEYTATGSFIFSHQLVIVPTRECTTTNYFTLYNKLVIVPIEKLTPNLVIVSNEECTSKNNLIPFCSHQVIVPIEEYTTTETLLLTPKK